MSIWFAVPLGLILAYVAGGCVVAFVQGFCEGLRQGAARSPRDTGHVAAPQKTDGTGLGEPELTAPGVHLILEIMTRWAPRLPEGDGVEEPGAADDDETPYRVIRCRAGMVTIEKTCPCCDREHQVAFPLDDLGVKRRMHALCDRCNAEIFRQ